MADANLTMIRGDTAAFGVVYDGTTQDLDSAYFTIKKDWTETTPTVQKSIGNGIEKLIHQHTSFGSLQMIQRF